MESCDENEALVTDTTDTEKKPLVPCRYILVFLLVLGTINVMAMRTAFNIALVAMVNFTRQDSMNNTNDECPVHYDGNHSKLQDRGEFIWDGTIQDTLLSAFFYGYISTQILGGFLADWVGAKFTIGIPILSVALLTLLIPVVAPFDVRLLIGVRVLQGVLSGPLYPSIVAIWGRWAPPQEKSKLVSWSACGGNLGVMVGEVTAGALCQTYFIGGWPSAFYVVGISGVLWSILWFCVAYDSPDKHPHISKAELDYIERSTGGVDKIKFRIPPLLKVVTSAPVWGTAMVFLGDGFAFNMMFNCVPLFMKQILNFDIAQNGFLSPLPFLMMWVTSVVAGVLADIVNRHISTTATRNIFTAVAEIGAALCLVAVALVGCNPTLAVLFLSLVGAFGGISGAGFQLGAVDNAPMYAGCLMGVYNSMTQIGGFLAPQVQGLITHGEPSRSKWQTMFYVTAGVAAAGSVMYMLLYSGEELEWATQTRTLSNNEKGAEKQEDERDENLTTQAPINS